MHIFTKWPLRAKANMISSLFFSLLFINNVNSAEFAGGANQVTVTDLPVDTIYIRVSGPNNFSFQTEQGVIYAPSNSLLVDGQYSYEITAQVSSKINAQGARINTGRESNVPTESPSAVVEYGYFRIMNGEVVNTNSEEEE
ncbi:hypothetical protein [Aliiglaciecola sp. NS0011-25]|uniref:hypothetical protein n=1 Tax=Aliiglaciecola sp. NS0011-25 TaxID=3127654 RepID=UPI003101E089